MYPHNTTNITINQEIEDKRQLLTDRDDTGKERPWRDKKLKTLVLAESYERLGFKKAERIRDCGVYLEYLRYLENQERKLYRANFCKVRLCPMCAWRRSKKIYSQVSSVMDKALEEREYRYLFLTLTVKNVEGEQLSSEIDNLFNAFNKLMKRVKVKSAVKGWFRSLEVTHNLENDTYHPHFHIILMVNKTYFKHSDSYITHEIWTELWKKSLKVDYRPIVHIEAFMTSSKAETIKSVSEVATYTVKDSDYLVTDEYGNIDEELTDSAVLILDKALAYRRLIAFGGKLKEIHKQLKLDDAVDGDLVGTDEEQIRTDLEYIIEKYEWKIGYSQYIKTCEIAVTKGEKSNG